MNLPYNRSTVEIFWSWVTTNATSASATVDDDTAGRFSTIQDQYIFILINHDYCEICFVFDKQWPYLLIWHLTWVAFILIGCATKSWHILCYLTYIFIIIIYFSPPNPRSIFRLHRQTTCQKFRLASDWYAITFMYVPLHSLGPYNVFVA